MPVEDWLLVPNRSEVGKTVKGLMTEVRGEWAAAASGRFIILNLCLRWEAVVCTHHHFRLYCCEWGRLRKLVRDCPGSKVRLQPFWIHCRWTLMHTDLWCPWKSLQEFPETSIRMLTQKDKNVDLPFFLFKGHTHTHTLTLKVLEPGK